MTLVDSAETTASVVARELASRGLLHTPSSAPSAPSATPGMPIPAAGQGSARFLATDAPARFARVGAVFMGEALAPELRPEAVELVDL